MLIGVVEGFYGPPWDRIDRLSFLDFTSRIGLNTYIYAPKWDPYHRNRWKAPYPREYEDMFLELNDLASRRNIETVYAISPGLTIRYGDPGDLSILIRKLEKMMSLGFNSIAILLDDIPPVLRGKKYRSLAEAQADLVNRVYDELTPRYTLFCPTYYWSIKEDYLKEIGELLDRNIHVMWTGPAIVSVRITVNDVKRFIEVTGRKPFIWDNYPVNDYFIMNGMMRLHLGPFKNRDPQIWEYVSGYVANPMNQAEASKIPIYTLSRMIRERESYDPSKALRDAIKDLFPPEEHDIVNYFVELNIASPFDPLADHIPTAEDIDKLEELLRRIEEISNYKLLEEIMYIIGKLHEILSRLKGVKTTLNPRILTAGDYWLPMSDEQLRHFFGEKINMRKVWV
ncbi:MAG: protein O-GlcNAcase [Thermoprotei archaeon]